MPAGGEDGGESSDGGESLPSKKSLFEINLFFLVNTRKGAPSSGVVRGLIDDANDEFDGDEESSSSSLLLLLFSGGGDSTSRPSTFRTTMSNENPFERRQHRMENILREIMIVGRVL